jgi:hypothetical protein
MNQTSDGSGAAAAAGAAGAGLFLLIYFAFLILMIASLWKVFSKAGQPGWACLIPIYNVYVLIKVAGKPGWWLLLMLIPFVNAIVSILVVAGVAKNFGKGVGFTLGLIFLPFIFYPILAFGDASYDGGVAPAMA